MALTAGQVSGIVVGVVVLVFLIAAAVGVGYQMLDPHAPVIIPLRLHTFQHNKRWKITDETYSYVYKYKRELLKNLTRLLNDLDIKFTIAHGNLIEFERGTPIYHDDDIDLRFDERDFDKWMAFCQRDDVQRTMPKYNLVFDDRLKQKVRQKDNGIQVGLLNFQNACSRCAKMDIHADLVASHVDSDFWPDYDVNFDRLRRVRFMDVHTYAPGTDDTHHVLRQDYGDYTRPHRLYKKKEFVVL